MSKSTLKTNYDPIKAEVIKRMAEESGFTPAFIRLAVKGERDSLTAEEIKKEFNRRYTAVKQALKTI